MKKLNRQTLQLLPALLIVFSVCSFLFLPQPASAAQITSRKLTLSTSSPAAAAATTTYTFNFTVPSGTVLQSAEAEVCTTASGSCTTPTGFSNSSSTLSSQPTNLGDAAGWTVSTVTAGKLRLKKTGNAAAPTGAQTVVFGNVQNPTTTNTTFYARIATYSDDAWTTGVDTGVVAASTATQINLDLTVDESLVFCTGTSITGTNCGTVSGSTVGLGTASTTSTSSGTSVMATSTNGNTGYVITVNGTTLTSGSNTITALSSPTASSTGTSQFGLNLKDNATPNVGAEVSPSPNGTTLRGQASTGYSTADSYKFVTGNQVAASDNSSAGPTDAQTFTVSYIANIPGSQAAGIYTAIMTYICTATF